MIAWLNPLGLVALLGVLAPILIHLLRQPRAVRVPFPSLRFVQPSRTVAARMRRIADPPLLLVRMAIVAAAALALAQPVVLTAGRLDVWNSRTARAIVLDAGRGTPTTEAAARARAEDETAHVSAVFEGSELRAAIARASAWLAAAPPARRELVLISDFRVGALPADVASVVPPGAGIRAVPVGEPETERRLAGAARFGTGARPDVRLTLEATEVAWTDASASGAGVRFLPEKASGLDTLVRAIAAAGTPEGSAAEPILLLLAGAGVPKTRAIEPGWMLDTVTRMSMDAELLRAAADGDGRFEAADPWFDIAWGADGRARVRAAAAGGELAVQIAAAPADYLTAAALRSALQARHGQVPVVFAPEEIVRLPAEAIAALEREPEPVGHEAASRLEPSDARWLWLAALVLLGVESWMRRPSAAGQQGEVVRAA